MKQTCLNCKQTADWQSQPTMHGKIPAGNLLLSFAILMAGAYISKPFSVQTYRKILIISPGLLFVQREFLVGLFSGGGGGGLLLEGILHFKNC